MKEWNRSPIVQGFEYQRVGSELCQEDILEAMGKSCGGGQEKQVTACQSSPPKKSWTRDAGNKGRGTKQVTEGDMKIDSSESKCGAREGKFKVTWQYPFWSVGGC